MNKSMPPRPIFVYRSDFAADNQDSEIFHKIIFAIQKCVPFKISLGA
jgi:hypothetical protein